MPRQGRCLSQKKPWGHQKSRPSTAVSPHATRLPSRACRTRPVRERSISARVVRARLPQGLSKWEVASSPAAIREGAAARLDRFAGNEEKHARSPMRGQHHDRKEPHQAEVPAGRSATHQNPPVACEGAQRVHRRGQGTERGQWRVVGAERSAAADGGRARADPGRMLAKSRMRL